MKILVTGLDGFTGHYVDLALKKAGHEVLECKSDLTNPASVVEEIKSLSFDAVIHLAAIAFVGHGNANAFYDVNLLGTRNLLQALTEHAPKLKSILLASSANVYGNRTEGVLSESAFPDPVNDYAVSKLAMEQMAKLYLDKLPLFFVRPFNYTGIGQEAHFLIPKIVNHFKDKSDVIELGNLHVWREFGDVRNVASIYQQLIEVAPVGQTLNICTGNSHSLLDVLEICQSISGHSLEVKVNPEFVRENEVKTLIGDPAKLQKLINQPNALLLEDTLAWMLAERG